MPQSEVGSMQGFTKGRLPLEVSFHQKLSSTQGCIPQKVLFHSRSSSTEGCLPPKVVFLLKVVFKWRLYSTNGRFPLKVVFNWMLSSTEGRLPPTMTPYICENSQLTKSHPPTCNDRCMMYDTWCMMHDAWCYTLVDLIFVRTVSIPNLSLLPCLEVA